MIRKLMVALTAVAGLVIFCLFFPPSLLKVKEVAVLSPPQHLSEFDLIRLSGVKRGDNLLTICLSRVREGILRFPWIREVRLSKRFPGRLLIWVEEHRPVALLEMNGLYLVSDQGVIFKKSEREDSLKDLPILKGLVQEDLGARLPPLISLIEFFEETESLRPIGLSELRWSREEGLSLMTRKPSVRVELGEDRWEERLGRLDRSWKLIRTTAERPKVIDLNFQKRIVVKQES